MKRARVIIGSGFGDEGKGLATDFYASQTGVHTLVVRFNGGAQAGHTVTTPGGRRHVFSHIGSGSINGARTYLSRYFVCHPMVFHRELNQLRSLGVVPRIYVDRECPVTTPYDVMINQAVESARGRGRHGSCGMGFGETLERHQFVPFRLTVRDLHSEPDLRRRLMDIRDRYTPSRLGALDVNKLPGPLFDDGIMERFIDDCRAFVQRVQVADSSILERACSLIFEGAQGLLLDMDRGMFPHVTRSNTGLKNVAALAAEAGVEMLDVSYVTRWYATRHGAGPLAHERDIPALVDFVDCTNQPNRWQGALRTGLLDTNELAESVRQDLSDGRALRVEHRWWITWADKAADRLEFVSDGVVRTGGIEDLAERLAGSTGASSYALAVGHTRDHVIDAVPHPRAAVA